MEAPIVRPGAVVMPVLDRLPENGLKAFLDITSKSLPVRRVADPDALVNAYIYLMMQTFSIGEILVVDGGGVLV